MTKTLQKMRILYAEDEAEIRESVTRFLSRYFAEVYSAADGVEAYELYKRHRPDAVLLDLQMPKMNGLELAKAIRQEGHYCAIVMLTAHTEVETLLQATELRLSKYLVKPVSPKAFKEALSIVALEYERTCGAWVDLDDGLQWYRETLRLYRHGKLVTLGAKERKLLALLIEKRGETVSYEEIMVQVWEDAWEKEISLGSVKNCVSRLRKAVPGIHVESIYGTGYRLLG